MRYCDADNFIRTKEDFVLSHFLSGKFHNDTSNSYSVQHDSVYIFNYLRCFDWQKTKDKRATRKREKRIKFIGPIIIHTIVDLPIAWKQFITTLTFWYPCSRIIKQLLSMPIKVLSAKKQFFIKTVQSLMYF